MSEGVRKTISNAGIYGIATIVHRSVSFIMLPIYTRYLTPADYGVVSLLSVATDLAALALGLQLTSGLFRFYFAQQSEGDRRAIVCTALCGAVFLKAMAVVLLVLLATPISKLLFDAVGYADLLALFSLSLVTNVLVELPMQYLRALDRAKAFVWVSIARLTVQLSLNILFVVVLEQGVLGVVISTVLSGFVVGLLLTLWLLSKTGLGLQLSVLKELAKYSWPLVISSAIAIYNGSAARVTLSHFGGLSEVGLLALAAKLAEMVRLLVLQPFMQAWGPQQFQVLKSKDAGTIYRRAFRLLVMLVFCVAGGIVLFAPEFLRIMSERQFWSASDLVPICVCATVVLSMAPFCRFGVMVSGRTIETARAAILAAISISLVAIILVPNFGAMGAAVAGIAGPATNLWWMNRQSVRDYNMHLQWSKFWLAGAIVAIAYLCSLMVAQPLLVSIAVKLLIWVMMVLTLYISPVLMPEDRESVSELTASVLRRIAARVKT